ncbi:Zinc finger CCCH domain-containing protein 14 [Camponotus floridanus]|uniref:Zinc finger CCCH domain-containing protein 14 n=1 Tax=Camponotus floridanus TaxID=104421 RepID=E2AEK3_CAMFO|nr:zinc finger CCCH domain-containing protein 14 [Camponotus floridanus]XP_011256799.1 zinc finger CCCH domain-containing protein 14 [Camponotus floridanus]EFN68126.1 Zinc finger CCCH domain-containing protein 14 [Camponotus floridanus]
MDTRGIEVTNQLRSAIRAKLNELGVRYDEELPDYILVMVVNKKSRQQMHDDLNLFLEDCTTIFVDWLHDQVLKKLQKVTVAKKKSSREFVPTVVVKQEEERKKRKISATSFLEDQTAEQSVVDKSLDKNTKNDKQQPVQKQQTIKPCVSNQNSEQSYSKSAEKNTKNVQSNKSRTDEGSTHSSESCQESASQNFTRDENATRDNITSENSAAKTADTIRDQKSNEVVQSSKSLKRSLETSSSHYDSVEKRDNEVKRSKPSEEEEKVDATTSPDTVSKKLKSCVNKPKITSVVSVKNRLGIASPRKKFEVYREKEGIGRSRPLEKRFDKSHRYDNDRSKSRTFDTDDRNSRRNRDGESSRHHDQVNRLNDVRSRIESNKSERLNKNAAESRERILNSGSKTDISTKKSMCTVKDRLGIAGINNKTQKQPIKSQETMDYRNNSRSLDQLSNSTKNIKDRLGPVRNNFRPMKRQSRDNEDDGPMMPVNLGAKEKEQEQEEDDELDNDNHSLSGPVKSRIVAVNRSASSVVAKTERKRSKTTNQAPFNATQHSGYGSAKSQSDKIGKEASSDVDDINIEDTRLPSKVIVTPRPLKPLQPTQKRATQSLLLRAVAEANQSVVTQKNPEPSLLDKKPVLKRLKPTPARDVSQNLSVHFNSNKRLVMEKIQVELNTVDNLDTEDVEPYVPQAVTDEHMGVVMSLFQRSDDNQKFLVTLNGYNNNLMKEKVGSEDDEERLEMEVNEDDEFALLTTHSETYAATTTTSAPSSTPVDLEAGAFRITTDGTEDDTEDISPKEASGEENNENCNTENMDKTDEAPRKRRKLSPIIYNRSHSPSPTRLKSTASLLPTLVPKLTDKRPESIGITVSDKSRENCRYWPNCTLGNKCAYFHPPVMCSVFPACKFGDKCAYKHPKCKFGLSCTKLGCMFSHPSQQCKYHPFCTKPACPYSHPVVSIPVTEATNQRAKFTWRRRD